MNTMTQERIERRRKAHHAALASLSNLAVPDGFSIWRKLRRLETKLYTVCVDYTNGENGVDSEDWEQAKEQGRAELRLIFGTLPKGVYINGDPRGHMLKLDCGSAGEPGVPIPEGMERDWGGDGILAAEITEEA